jgi:hypothetical protein
MRKLIISAFCGATIALGAVVYLAWPGVQTDVFTPVEISVNMPKILLLPAESNECQRRRVLDGNGGATDQIDLVDGSTKEVVFKKLPNIFQETVYYPAANITSCESFSKASENANPAVAVATLRGPIKSFSERDKSGFSPVREYKYALDGKRVSAGFLIDKGARFQTDLFNAAGLNSRSEIYNLVTKAPEAEILYRADGTALLKQGLGDTANTFNRDHYSLDGKYVEWKEYRSYGTYKVTMNYPNGNVRLEAARGHSAYTFVKEYRENGSAIKQVQLWDSSNVDIAIYDESGNPTLETKWRIDRNLPRDQFGNPGMKLTGVLEVNEKNRPIRRFEFGADGNLKMVTLHKDFEYYKGKVEHTLDASGRVVSTKVYNDQGSPGEPIVHARDPGYRFTVPAAYFVNPGYQVPKNIYAHDDELLKEIPYSPGMQ